MRPYNFITVLFLFLLCFSCNEDISEIQNVAVVSAPVERELRIPVSKTLKGTKLQLDRINSKKTPISALKKADAKKDTITASPFQTNLVNNLPGVTPGKNGYQKANIEHPENKTIRSELPDVIKTLPPRYKDAANRDFQYLDVAQNFISSYVWDIVQDDDGFLWFATYGSGIARYDGHKLYHFTEDHGLPSNYVWGIEKDIEGNIWIATYGAGLSKFDGKTFTNFTSEDGLGTDYIFCIEEDSEGNIWIGTDGAGIVKYDGKTFSRYSMESGLLSDRVIDIEQDKSRNLWLASFQGGISRFDGQTFEHITTQEGLPSNKVTCVEVDSSGNIWIGTEDAGIAKLEEDKLLIFNDENGLSSGGVHDIVQGEDGKIWIATEGGGISSYDGDSFMNFTTKEGVSSDYVRSCYNDQEGNIWFGTDGGGVMRYHPGSFRHFTEKDGLLSDFIWCTFEDSKGNLWYGTDGSGAFKYDGKNYTYLTEEDGLSNNIVLSIAEDDKGNIWFATDLGGISIYDGEKIENIGLNEGLPSISIWDIMKTSDGNIWIATNDAGICKYDGKHLTHYTKEDGLLSNTITQLLEDEDGYIWMIAENSGISQFDGKKIRHYTEENGLSSNAAQTIYEDNSGTLWIGYNGDGLDKLNDQSITHFSTKQGLASNYIWSVIEDNEQRLWVCTEKGISCMENNLSSDKSLPPIQNFSRLDGLKALDFYVNSVCLDSKNRLWMGSSLSLTMLNLDKFSLKKTKPKVHITGLRINERNINYAQNPEHDSLGYSYTSVSKKQNVPEQLKLEYDNNHLTFHFSGIDWNAPQKIRYSYMLRGIDKKWSNPASENKADYRNIPPGKHTFMVKAISKNGEWSVPAEIQFTVFSPWWQTWWAYLGYFIVALLVISIAYKLRTIKYRKRQAELEKTVQRRTSKISAQKKEIEKKQGEVLAAYNQLEEKNGEILDSINYAKKIQAAILPSKPKIQKYLPESFVLYIPKDIVAGDFYWCEHLDDLVFIAAADCTGHGVPGAMVSVICNNALNKSLHEHGLTDPAEILNKTREIVIDKFEQSEDGIRDGMDISLAVFNKKSNKLKWAGANNPLWIIRKGDKTVEEIKGDRQPIGKYPSSSPFTTHEITYEKGDTLYMLTDGFPDQFGGEKGKKYKYARLKKFLLSIRYDSLDVQPIKLQTELNQWRKDLEQIDDVCVIGIRV